MVSVPLAIHNMLFGMAVDPVEVLYIRRRKEIVVMKTGNRKIDGVSEILTSFFCNAGIDNVEKIC